MFYPRSESARRVVDDAGLQNKGHINFDGALKGIWHSILSEAEKSAQVPDLVNVVLREYGTNPQLKQAWRDYQQHRLNAPKDDRSDRDPLPSTTLDDAGGHHPSGQDPRQDQDRPPANERDALPDWFPWAGLVLLLATFLFLIWLILTERSVTRGKCFSDHGCLCAGCRICWLLSGRVGSGYGKRLSS